MALSDDELLSFGRRQLATGLSDDELLSYRRTRPARGLSDDELLFRSRRSQPATATPAPEPDRRELYTAGGRAEAAPEATTEAPSARPATTLMDMVREAEGMSLEERAELIRQAGGDRFSGRGANMDVWGGVPAVQRQEYVRALRGLNEGKSADDVLGRSGEVLSREGYDPLVDLAQQPAQITRGALETAALIPKAGAVLGYNFEGNEFDRQREAMRLIDSGEMPEGGRQRLRMLDVANYRQMTPEKRAEFKAEFERVLANRQGIEDSPLYRAGEAIERGASAIPIKEGYEETPLGMVGRGLGSVGTGIVLSAAGGPLASSSAFMLMGMGEAADRALESGATDQEVIDATILGALPGLTDSLPVEVLLGRLPIPGGKYVGQFIKLPKGQVGKALKALGRLGTQAFVEGVQEGGQEFLQNLIAQQVYDEEQGLTEGIIPSTAVGGAVGAVTETIKMGIENFAGRRRGRGIRERAKETPPPITPEDEASPIPTDLIARGRARVKDAEASVSANEILTRNNIPSVGSRVSIDFEGGPRTGRIEDVFQTELNELGTVEDGVRVQFDDGTFADLFMREIRDSGLAITPLTQEDEDAVPTGRTVDGGQRGTGADGARPAAGPSAQADEPGTGTDATRPTDDGTQDVPAGGVLQPGSVPGPATTGPSAVIAGSDDGTPRSLAADPDAELRTAATGDAAAGGNAIPEPAQGTDGRDAAAAGQAEPGAPQRPVGDGSRQAPIDVKTPEDIEAARPQSVPDASAAQQEAGNHKMAHIKLDGRDVTIQRAKGTIRRGVGPNGSEWQNEVLNDEGHFLGTKGADGEPVDVVIGPDPGLPDVYVVAQQNPETDEFDENKVLIGFANDQDAFNAYVDRFNDGSGVSRVQGITKISREELSEALDNDALAQALPQREGAVARGPARRPAQGLEGGELTEALNRNLAELDSQVDEIDRQIELEESMSDPDETELKELRSQRERIDGKRRELVNQLHNGGFFKNALSDEELIKRSKAEAKPAPKPEAKPDRQPPKQAAISKWREIGVNADGERVFEDKDGIRSVLTDKGIRVSETVEMRPTRQGVQVVKPATREDQYKTQDELEEEGITRAESETDEAGEDLGHFETNRVNLPIPETFEAADEFERGFPDAGFSSQYALDYLNGWAAHRNGDLRPTKNDVEQSGFDARESIHPRGRAATKPAAQPPAPAPKGDRIVSDDEYADLRKQFLNKLKNTTSAGLDPELVSIGVRMAVYHIENGVRKFVDVARALASDLGVKMSEIRPYLRSWYNGARDMMEDTGLDISGMDGPDEVRAALETLTDGAPSAAPTPEPEPTPQPAPKPSNGVTVTQNEQRDGVEIKFASRPDPQTLLRLKSNGFRWSKRKGLWYAKRSEKTLRLANEIAGAQPAAPTRPEAATPARDEGAPRVPGLKAKPGSLVYEAALAVAKTEITESKADALVVLTGYASNPKIDLDELADAYKSMVEFARENPGVLFPAQASQTPRLSEEDATASAYGTLEEPNVVALARALKSSIADGSLQTIIDARRIVGQLLNGAVKPGTEAAKAVDEAVELAAVLAARDAVKKGTPEEIYQKLVDMYEAMPNLSVRTSSSVLNQAYSTPVPLGYLAQRLAGIDADTRVFEPSAGNGALLTTADPNNIVANEIDEDRRAALEAQNFGEVTDIDASTGVQASLLSKDVDVVIANPPFGVVKNERGESKTWDLGGGYRTNEIDHVIALRSLVAMKDDGKAVLIIGGLNKLQKTEEARSDGYNSKAKREFFLTLYREYNVVDHFTVAGELYAKQGAGWPVDVIVIEGRGKSSRSLPAVDVPRVYTSFEDLRELLDGPRREEATGTPQGETTRTPEGGGRSPGGSPQREPGDGANGGRGNAGVRGGPGNVRGGSNASEPRPSGTGAVPSGTQPESGSGGNRDGLDRTSRVKSAPTPIGEETATQVAYTPRSERGDGMGTLVPVNMKDSIENALAALEDRVGNIDEFVATELGYEIDDLKKYFGAEQIDALALAIDNFNSGSGFIIGDQTGIGKGRVVAGVLRYAIKNEMNPIFVTEKPNLYGDIYRDLAATGIEEFLGREPRIIVTNAGINLPLDDKETVFLKTKKASEHNAHLLDIADEGYLEDYDLIFTTYNQMQTVKGQATPRMTFLQQMSHGAVVVFDESHNAGGTESGGGWGKKDEDGQPEVMGRAGFARAIARNAGAVFYSSATYAKRPSVMDLYFKTDMALAVQKISDLAALIARGRVPMQQIVATMLAKAGQYIRRERSFAGITYETDMIPVDRQSYDDFSYGLKRVQTFSEKYVKRSAKRMDKDLKNEGKKLTGDGSTGGAGATSTNFTSVMHNVINQFLLALKADSAADRAIEAIKNGEKPVLTVASTMGSFIRDYTDTVGINPGDEINVTFAQVLQRYLERSRHVIVRAPFGQGSERVRLTDEQLGPDGAKFFNDSMEFLANIAVGRLPISPIDHIHARIKAAGFKSGEITGRKETIEYRPDGTGIYKIRSQKEISPAGRRRTITAYNDGGLDALILNQAGSTGLSLHANVDFKDKRKRKMFVVQPEGNIDTHMQLLGRVNRTGQVVLPSYSQLVAAVPAENRPAAVLAKKMASLNANTTAARGSALTAEDTPDFLNEYGDIVAASLMTENPELHEELGEPLNQSETGLEIQDAMRKVTGRIPLLPLARQEDVYDQLLTSYASLVEQRQAAGENILEAATLDLDAKLIDRIAVQSTPAVKVSPFTEPVYFDLVDIKALTKPLTSEELVAEVSDAVSIPEGESIPRDDALAALQKLSTYATRETEETKREYQALFAKWRDEYLANFEVPEVIDAQRTRINGVWRRWSETIDDLYAGRAVVLKTDTMGNVHGIVTGLSRRKSKGNPVALSAWNVTVATANGPRKITMSFLDLVKENSGTASGDLSMVYAPRSYTDAAGSITEMFDEMQNKAREERVIVTGNIMSGYSYVNNTGQIINYTDDEGNVKQGILMKREFDPSDFISAKPVSFPTGRSIISFLKASRQVTRITSADGAVTISVVGDEVTIGVASSKLRGGKYFLNAGVIASAGKNFVKSGGQMVVRLYDETAENTVDEIINVGAEFTAQKDHDLARQIIAGRGGVGLPRRVRQSKQITRDARSVDVTNEWTDHVARRGDMGDPAGINESIIDFLTERGTRTGHEAIVTYDAISRSVLGVSTTNQESQAVLNEAGWDAVEDPNRSIVLHHNHPEDSSLSNADIGLLSNPGMAWITAASHNGSWYAARLTPRLQAELRRASSEVGVGARALAIRNWALGLSDVSFAPEKEIARLLDQLVRAGEATEQEADYIFAHLQNVVLAEAGVIEYLYDYQIPKKFEPVITELVRPNSMAQQMVLAELDKLLSKGPLSGRTGEITDGNTDRRYRAVSKAGGLRQILEGIAGDARRARGAVRNQGGRGPQGPRNPVRQGNDRRGQNGQPPGQVTQYSIAPTFYSALRRGIENEKQDSAPALQWRSRIKNMPGVKQEEVDWTGLDVWLADKKNEKVSKAEILQFLEENDVQIEEVTKEDGGALEDVYPDNLSGWEEDREARTYWDEAESELSDVAKTKTYRFEDAEVTLHYEQNAWRPHLVTARVGGQDIGEFGDFIEAREAIENHNAVAAPPGANGATRFNRPDLVLPGGKNYRELLLTLPVRNTAGGKLAAEFARSMREKYGERWVSSMSRDESAEYDRYISQQYNEEADRTFSGNHFQEDNIIAHVRFNDRVDTDGKRTLFVEEIQSDWHQRGRKRGYSGTPVFGTINRKSGYPGQSFPTREEAEAYVASLPEETRNNVEIRQGKMSGGVPNAPFKTSWHELAFKRMLRYAAENGYDQIAWTTGQQQADRYSLENQVDYLLYKKNDDGTFRVSAQVERGGRGHLIGERIEAERLEDYVGKEVAQRVIDGVGSDENLGGPGTASQPRDMWKKLEGVDLRVGGEGMKGFYDRILPQFANKYAKKWGAKVGETEIGIQGRTGLRVEEDDESWRVVDRDGNFVANVGTLSEAEQFIREDDESDYVGVHALPITDAMRESVMEGQPLFAAQSPAQSNVVRFENRAQKLERLKTLLNDRLQALGLSGKVTLDIVEKLIGPDGREARGRYFERLIEVSLKGDHQEWTINHEIIHALRELGVIRDGEWAILSRAAARDKVLMADVRARYAKAGLTEEQLIEEAVADYFANWTVGKKPAPNSMAARVFARLANFIRALGNMLRMSGFQSAEDVLGRIDAGVVGNRVDLNQIQEEADIRFEAALRELIDGMPSKQALNQAFAEGDAHIAVWARDWHILKDENGVYEIKNQDSAHVAFIKPLPKGGYSLSVLGTPVIGRFETYPEAVAWVLGDDEVQAATPNGPRYATGRDEDEPGPLGLSQSAAPPASPLSSIRSMLRRGGSTPSVPPKGPTPSVVFDDPDSWARVQEAMKGQGSGDSIVMRARAHIASFAEGFTRHYRHLPVTAEFSDVREKLRQLEASDENAKEEIVRLLSSITKGFNAADMELFTLKVFLDDMMWEVDQDHALGFGMDPASAKRERAKVDRALATRPDIVDAIRRRKLVVRTIADKLVAAGILSKERIKNPAYYRHQIMDYIRVNERLASNPKTKLQAPKWARRSGSTKDYNLRYLEAEFDWMYKALNGLSEAEVISWLKTSGHNIRGDVIAKARAHNKTELDKIIAKDIADNGWTTSTGRQTSPLNEIFLGFRQRIAMGFDKVKYAIESGALTGIPPHLQDAADAVEAGTGDENVFDFLAWILDNDLPGSMGAAMAFKAISNRKSYTQKLLGRNYADPRDIKGLVARGFAPEGYKIWQPEDGKMLFVARTITENVIDRVSASIEKASDQELIDMLSLNDVAGARDAVGELVAGIKEAARDNLMVGGDRYQMILPAEIVDTLNELRPEPVHGVPRLLQTVTSSWKIWTLVNPRRWGRYNLNNTSGDLDAVIAGNPKLLRDLPRATKELWGVTVRRNRVPSATYRSAMKRGVLQAGMTLQELPDINKFAEFERLFENTAKQTATKLSLMPFRKLWGFLKGSTTFRENMLRYAAYINYLERLNAGESMESIGYGASLREMVDALDNNEDKAALLARELIGDYGNVSHLGMELRTKYIPFYSWMEVNLKRYWRLTRNAYAAGRMKGIRTGGALGLAMGLRTAGWLYMRMFAVYAMANMWNYLFFPDEEDDLTEDQRRQLHLILGRNSAGEVHSIRFQGALSDALAWTGFGDVTAMLNEYQRGRASLWEVLTAAPKAVTNKVVGGVTPMIMAPLEAVTGAKLWPDAFNPRRIRDRWRNVAQLFSVENEYDLIFDKPSRGYGKSWIGAITYQRNPGENAYNDTLGLVYDWLERETGRRFAGGYSSPRADALYEWRQALRYGDEDAARNARERLRELDMSLSDAAASIERAHPLGPLPRRDRNRFLDTLNERERERLDEATKWYEETFNPRGWRQEWLSESRGLQEAAE